MQDKRDTGQEGCRKGGMKGRSNEEKEGFRSGKNQDWRDTRKEGFRTRGIQ